jgi:lipopolysaccharide transport system ATP-binding protein
MEEVISLTQVSKIYKLFSTNTDRMWEALHPGKKMFHQEFFALEDVNLKVLKGEILGIVGMNGSGKSSLLKLIAGITQASRGKINVKGSVVALIELGAGFNPEFTGLQNIYFYNSIMGFSKKETDKLLDKIIDFAEIGEFINQPLKTYSSGMMARLSFSVSVNINPDILIIDEILSVGDELFRRKSFSKMEEFISSGKTILFVSHSVAQINQICSKAIMLHKGRIVLEGSPKYITMNYDKFLFSNPEKKKIMLEQGFPLDENSDDNGTIQNLSSGQHQIIQPTQAEIPLGKSYYLSNFLTKSAVVTINSNVEVTGFSIETMSGMKVNVLARNEDFKFSYIMHFNEDVGNLNFGIGIKNASGVVLNWIVFPGKAKYVDQVTKCGDSLLVGWKFKCKFLPGTYFVNTGIRNKINGIENLIYKGADIFAFKVVEGDSAKEGGIFDISMSGSFIKL